MTKIFAHRGNAIKEAENTMDAFQSAIELNADGIELDIHKTRDSKIIVTHDENLKRVTGTDLNIAEASYDQIKTLNAAAFLNDGRKSHVPLLEEVLDLIKNTDLDINIELKNNLVIYPEFEEDVLALVSQYELAERCVFSSFNHYSIIKLRDLGTENELAFLYQEGLYQPWEYAKNNNVGGLHPFFPNLIIPQYVELAHERDIKVRPWTIDDPEQMAMLIALGVDGLITNDPATAVKVRANLNNN